MKRTLVLFILVATCAVAQDPNLGVSLSGLGGPPEKRIEVAKQLGAAWYRPEPVLLGVSVPKCDDCVPARTAGLKVVTVVRNATSANKPSSAVKDIPAFTQKLKSVIDQYKPEIVVVENEPEDEKNSFSGTAEEFAAELNAACEVAHAANIQCAPGGAGSVAMAGLVIDELWKSDHLEAAGFGITTEMVRARTREPLTFMGKDIAKGSRDEQAVIEKATSEFLQKHRAEIDRTRAFVSAAASANIDRANFHWYELKPEEVTTVLDILGRLSKHPPMTDEVGQRQERPFETGEKIRLLLEAGVSPVIWSGTDGKNTVGLVEKNGSIGANGRAFQAASRKTENK